MNRTSRDKNWNSKWTLVSISGKGDLYDKILRIIISTFQKIIKSCCIS